MMSQNDSTNSSASSKQVSDVVNVDEKRTKSLPNKDNLRVWEVDTTGKYVRSSSVRAEAPLHRLQVEYDPHRHRTTKNTVGNVAALLLIVKGCIGTGVLSMPQGFSYCGLVGGVVGVFMMGCFISYSMNLLIRTEYLLCKRKRVSYLSFGEAMQYAMEEGPDWMIRWSKASRLFVNVTLAMQQVAVCSIYYIAVCKSIKTIIDNNFICDLYPVRVIMCIMFVAFLIINCIPNMKVLSYFSAAALSMMFASFALISYHTFLQVPSIDKSYLTGSPTALLSFLQISLFAVQAVGVHFSIEEHMAHPKDFLGVFGVMNMAMVFICCTYVFVGFIGYWFYGNSVQGSLIAHLPPNSKLTLCVYALLDLALLVTFRLYSFPFIDIVWYEHVEPRLEETSKKQQMVYKYSLLSLFVVLVFVVSQSLMEVILIITSFSATIHSALLAIAFPAVMQLCHLWPDKFGRHDWIYYKDLAMIALSFFVLLGGFYLVVGELLHTSPAVTCAERNTTRG